MLRPVAFAVDETYDVLYVLSNDGTGSSKRNIFVINNASTSHYTSSATLGPSFRKILTGGVLDSGTQGIRRMALVGNSLYINQYDDMKVFVFDNMHTYVNGQTATVSRTINLSGKPAGIAIDTVNDLMFVSMYDSNQIHVYSNASTINGTVSPIRTMSGPSISGPCGMRFIPSLNRLYVTNYTPQTLIVIANATTANGTITPIYTLSGIPTVADVAVDLTR
jgi:DNA-binding beta-propeller fold protein YncE